MSYIETIPAKSENFVTLSKRSKASMSPGLDVEKSLELSKRALLLPDNIFKSLILHF